MEKDYPLLKKEAIRLRKKGFSYNRIKEKINVSKSTLSLWLKSVPLKPEYRKRLYTKRIQNLARGPYSQRERRRREVENIIKEAKREIKGPLSFEIYRLFGAALYWAEGSKSTMFKITNSDPHFILFMVHWVEKMFGISRKELKANLDIHSQQNKKDIEKFWSDLTGIPLERFGKTQIKPYSTGFKKNNLYYGTFRIYVPKSADFKVRVFGWIQAVLQDIDPKIKLIEGRWKKLKKIPRPFNID